ncbi:MAG: VOC family protein [Actinomycetota bacterium]|nr:VOC family protein [Actinomycetota bacterium]
MDMDEYAEGVPSWVDLSSPDPSAASAFYAALFGWECPEGPPETGGYRVCTLRGRSVAGIGPQMNPGPPVWSTYVNTADVDAAANRAIEAGGQVLAPPFDVMDAGRMAIVADPTGAVIGVWQPGTHRGAQVANEPGAWGWSELVATDLDASEAFLTRVFGWGAERNPPEGPTQYLEWKVDGRSVSGAMPKPPSMPASVPAYWGLYFLVDDTDATAAKITELGGTLMMPPTDIEPGRFALCVDPTGAMFSVLTMRAAA